MTISLEILPGNNKVPQVELVVKNPPANVGDIRDVGLIPGWGRSPGEGHGNPLQYPCLENPWTKEPWWATVHRVARSQIQLKDLAAASSACYMLSPILGAGVQL